MIGLRRWAGQPSVHHCHCATVTGEGGVSRAVGFWFVNVERRRSEYGGGSNIWFRVRNLVLTADGEKTVRLLN